MKTYKAKLKHDKGIVCLRVLAENEQEAIKQICDAEMCPERAIEKIIEILPRHERVSNPGRYWKSKGKNVLKTI